MHAKHCIVVPSQERLFRLRCRQRNRCLICTFYLFVSIYLRDNLNAIERYYRPLFASTCSDTMLDSSIRTKKQWTTMVVVDC